MSLPHQQQTISPETSPASDPWTWKWLSAAYFLILGGALFSCLWGDTLGFDIWFHLKNGWRIFTERAIPHDDPSLPALTKLGSWYFPNYEWLFALMSYTIFNAAGTWGLDAFRLTLVFTTFGLCLATGLREIRRSNPDRQGFPWAFLPLAMAVLSLAIAASTRRFEPRPHLISALGLAWLSFTFSARPSTPMLAVTTGILVVWANSHIEFMLGLGLIILLAAREFLERWLCRPADTAGKTDSGIMSAFRDWLPDARPFLFLFAAGITAFLLTPASWRVIPLASEYYARQAATMRQFGFGVNELLPLSDWWSGPWGMLLGLGVLGLLGSRDRRSAVIRLLPGIPFILLPFTSARHLYPAVIMLSPIIMAMLFDLFARFEIAGLGGKRLVTAVSIGLLPCCLGLYAGAFVNPHLPFPVLEIGNQPYLPFRSYNFYPEQSVRFLIDQKLKGTVFTLDRWGNFLLAMDGLTASAPERRPFIHNMNQTFPYKLLEDYLKIITDSSSRQALIEFYEIEIFLLPLRQAAYFQELADWLQNSPDWKLVSWDDTACVFLRAASNLNSGKDLPAARGIKPMAFTADEGLLRKIPDLDLGIEELERQIKTGHGSIAWNSHLWLGTLLEWRGNEPHAIEVLRQACTLNPGGFAALFRLGGLLGKIGQAAEAAAFLDKARVVCPVDAANRFNLAVAYKKNGQLRECRELLQRIRETNPGFAPARNLLETLSGN